MKKILFFLLLGISAPGFSQLIVNNNTLTPEQLVQNILGGPGVTITNVTFNGAAATSISPQAGEFNGASSNIGMNNGVILATGDANVAEGPNNQGGASLGAGGGGSDPDLNAISTNVLFDQAILEFDFIPQGDTISFNYIFASEEYNEFVCSGFNDVFGFFISGPGIAGPYTNGAENIALVPGTTTAVAINTINPGVAGSSGNPANCTAIDPNWTSYSVYHVTNSQNSVQYDAWTVKLEAKRAVQCNQTYHIKLAIADAGDGSWDSGVFLEAGSLSSDGVNVDLTTLTGTDTIIEGCNNGATFIFTRTNTDTTFTIQYDIGGNAVNGTDYNLISNNITFPTGQDSVLLNITALSDFVSNENDSLVITVYTITACGDTVINSATLYLIDPPSLSASANPVTFVACPGNIVTFDGSATGGTPPYSFYWSFGANTPVATDTIKIFGEVTLEVVDACGRMDEVTITPTGCPIVIPNIFTPNGDGSNDVFEISYLSTHPNSILTIYNRWGNIVYESSNYQSDWKGGDCPDGVYFYILRLTDGTEPADYKGFVHINGKN